MEKGKGAVSYDGAAGCGVFNHVLEVLRALIHPAEGAGEVAGRAEGVWIVQSSHAQVGALGHHGAWRMVPRHGACW